MTLSVEETSSQPGPSTSDTGSTPFTAETSAESTTQQSRKRKQQKERLERSKILEQVINHIANKYVAKERHEEFSRDLLDNVLKVLPDIHTDTLEKNLEFEELIKGEKSTVAYNKKRDELSHAMEQSTFEDSSLNAPIVLTGPLPTDSVDMLFKHVTDLVQLEHSVNCNKLCIKIRLGQVFSFYRKYFKSIPKLHNYLTQQHVEYSRIEINRCINFYDLSIQYPLFQTVKLPIYRLLNFKMLKEILLNNRSFWSNT